MNETSRTELLAILEELSRRYPDWRFGQLVANLADWVDQEIWDVEDQQLVKSAKAHLEQLLDVASK